MPPLAVERYKFIDESGINLAMTRLFGRAPRGERVVDTIPQNDGANVTMIGALSLQGLDAVMTVDGATDGRCPGPMLSRSWGRRVIFKSCG
jgi:hypothetical protein